MATLVEEIFKGGAEGIFTGIRSIIGLWKADPTVTAQNSVRILEIESAANQAEMQAALQIQLAQARINELEAQSSDKFSSRWRPFIGWVCGIGLVYAFIGQPLLVWGSINFKWLVPPTLDVDVLMTLLFGMLGLGGMRSFDKAKGTAK